jgi:hypothetical protein
MDSITKKRDNVTTETTKKEICAVTANNFVDYEWFQLLLVSKIAAPANR